MVADLTVLKRHGRVLAFAGAGVAGVFIGYAFRNSLAAPVLWMVAGLSLGVALTQWRIGRVTRHVDRGGVVAQDIQALHMAFGVLERQVSSTISSSEEAVSAMAERIGRIHTSAAEMRQRIMDAVQRSQALSSSSVHSAGEHARTVAALAEHQSRFEASQDAYRQQVAAVNDKVRQLTPLATSISEISRMTNLLAINASIEAARAGQEGAGFKVVAAEVRRLSMQTAQAARQIGDGISEATSAIDAEVDGSADRQSEGAAHQLGSIAEHMQGMGETLADVVGYLESLAAQMDVDMRQLTVDIVDTLGDMQFQDINRQRLEQINTALSGLSSHFAQVYKLIDGEAPPPPQMLQDLLAQWTESYVMLSQHEDHARVAIERASESSRRPTAIRSDSERDAQEPAADERPVVVESAAAGPRIEFF